MTTFLLFAFLIPLSLSLAFTPLAIRLAFLCDAIDRPNERKVHTNPIPRFGGMAISASFFVSIGILFSIFPEFLVSSSGIWSLLESAVMYSLAICALLMILILGAWDDISGLSPGFKFIVQFIAATLAYLAGFNISLVSDPFSTGLINLELLSYPITIIWIVGVTNAFNLIDGLDGLASGTAVIALATIGSISFFHAQPATLVICLLSAGAVLGFLWYNFRPAKIFLGDSGSLFLGFLLALLSIQSFTKVTTSFAMLIPFLALGLPIIDTLLSMVRRFLSWFLPDRFSNEENITFRQILKSIFQPDKSHIHHQLLQRGFTHKHTVLVLYVVSAISGAAAVAVSLTAQPMTTIIVLFGILLIALSGIRRLKYPEIELFHNGIFLTFYRRLLINRQSLQWAFDSFFILAAFTGAYILTQPGQWRAEYFAGGTDLDLSLLLFVFLLQSGVLWISGLYRETIQLLGIADIFQIARSVGLAVILTAAVLFLVPYWHFDSAFTLYLLNFYLLGTMVLGLRTFFHLFKYLFRSRRGNQKVLIYGAGERGMLTLHRLLTMKSDIYSPVGFLDENPQLEGKSINGYPVFGGHWKLEQMIRKKGIRTLFISEDHLNPRIRNRIERIAIRYDLKVKVFHPRFDELPLFGSPTGQPVEKKIFYAN